MINEKTCLLIGGPRNGHRMTVSDGREMLFVPVVKTSYAFFASIEDAEPIAPTPKATAYYLERLRGKNRTIWFYRHESIGIDEALHMLFERYPQEPAEART